MICYHIYSKCPVQKIPLIWDHFEEKYNFPSKYLNKYKYSYGNKLCSPWELSYLVLLTWEINRNMCSNLTALSGNIWDYNNPNVCIYLYAQIFYYTESLFLVTLNYCQVRFLWILLVCNSFLIISNCFVNFRCSLVWSLQGSGSRICQGCQTA